MLVKASWNLTQRHSINGRILLSPSKGKERVTFRANETIGDYREGNIKLDGHCDKTYYWISQTTEKSQQTEYLVCDEYVEFAL